MSNIITITRLKPNKIQLIQTLVENNDALASDVISSMQFFFANNLNTNCPTCVVNGSSTGFLKDSKQVNIPCYTCSGYLKYNTPSGNQSLPTNPFNTIVLSSVNLKVLPADLIESVNGFSLSLQTAKLSDLIPLLQTNLLITLNHDCPTCSHTGNVLIQNSYSMCPTCIGMQKTAREYQLTNGKTTLVIPNTAFPNPLPVYTLE